MDEYTKSADRSDISFFSGKVPVVFPTATRLPRIVESKRPVLADWNLGFEHPKNVQACAYWKSRCDQRSMPSRDDLQFSAMARFAAHIVLVDVRAAPDTRTEYFIRLAGTQCEAVFGSVSGRTTIQVAPAHIEKRWRSVFDMVLNAKLPVRITAGIEFADKVWLETESLIAPLGRDGDVSMLFICFTASNVDLGKGSG